MKNISLHAPLNNTNRNWERALIKKANSGGSSLEKGTYAFTLYSMPEEIIAEEFPNPPELIAIDTPEYSLYHLEKRISSESSPTSAYGLVVLHGYNDLTIAIQIKDTSESAVKLAGAFTYDGSIDDIQLILGDVTFIGEGSHWHTDDGDIVPYIYIQDDTFNETLYEAIGAFLDYEFPQRS